MNYMVTISKSVIQEAFDGRNYYIPSFFRIKLGVLANFHDVPNIPFGAFSFFFHEYVHYLQDVTTLYGLMNLSVTTYFVRSVAASVGKMEKGTFRVPQEIQDNRGDFGFRNLLLRKYYVGSPINPKHQQVEIVSYEVRQTDVQGETIEYVHLVYKDTQTNEEHCSIFGGNILTEGMAYMIERRCFQSVFTQNGFPYKDASDYPYMINWMLAELIYPDLAKYLEFVVGVADLSLLTFNPGLTFVKLLEHLRDIGFVKRVQVNNDEDVINICDELYRIGHEFIHFTIERFANIQSYVYDEIKEYFKMPIASELNDWINVVWKKAKELRDIAPHYFLDVLLCNQGDVRSNPAFCSIYLGLGTPLVINSDNEGSIVPPQGFKPSESFMPGLYWAIDEIRRIFGGDYRAKECLLKDYCKWSSTQSGSQITVNERCDNAPWKRAQEDTDYCPVAAIWRHWNLTGHEPIFETGQ